MKPVVTVLGEIRVPRLGIVTVVQNAMEDAWQIQLTRDVHSGPLMTIAVVGSQVMFRKHDYKEESEIDFTP